MNKTKSVRFQETIDVYICPSDDTIDTEDDGDLSELALDLAESAITAAIKTVEEDEYTVKDINWITHGEFTAERGRKQIEEFVLDAPVDVSFIFEGQSLVHRPGKTRFREKWTRDLVEAKHILMESNPF
uniref:A-kinase anchoring protein 14 n=1 Tax=Rousettus aegyptiacus TaxID=9407 RepID=A0A7J8EHK1_ROUAE|nr:A-kinase anchoring protein 14 [Rousettus aegyptiacus]